MLAPVAGFVTAAAATEWCSPWPEGRMKYPDGSFTAVTGNGCLKHLVFKGRKFQLAGPRPCSESKNVAGATAGGGHHWLTSVTAARGCAQGIGQVC